MDLGGREFIPALADKCSTNFKFGYPQGATSWGFDVHKFVGLKQFRPAGFHITLMAKFSILSFFFGEETRFDFIKNRIISVFFYLFLQLSQKISFFFFVTLIIFPQHS